MKTFCAFLQHLKIEHDHFRFFLPRAVGSSVLSAAEASLLGQVRGSLAAQTRGQHPLQESGPPAAVRVRIT